MPCRSKLLHTEDFQIPDRILFAKNIVGTKIEKDTMNKKAGIDSIWR